jgi:hypothetical protein
MHPALGFGVIAVLLLTLSLVRLAIRRRERGRQAVRKTRSVVGAVDTQYAMMGPTTLREAEDRIPTIDEHGNRLVVIRTRTLETVLGPIGPLEIERKRRLTLPGHGHVFAVSDTEFEIFHSRTRLRIDAASLTDRRGRTASPE